MKQFLIKLVVVLGAILTVLGVFAGTAAAEPVSPNVEKCVVGHFPYN